MIQLDTYTLHFANFLLSLIMATTMFLMFRANKSEKCLLDWASAGLFNVAAYAMNSFMTQYQVGSFAAALDLGVINTLYIMAHLAILRGLLRFFKLKLYTKEMAVFAITLAVLHIIPHIQTSLSYRIYLFTAMTLLVKIFSIYLLINAINKTKQWSFIPLLITEVFFISQLLIRSFQVYLQDTPVLNVDINSPIQTIGWLSDLLFITVAIISCVLIVMRKQTLEIERLSNTDQLTGCFNRRAMQHQIDNAFSNLSCSNLKMALVMIDIDFFKKINDSYGHDVGDSALQHVANVIQKNIRQSDTLFRLGGEEFVILVTGSNDSGLKILAENLRKRIEESPLNIEGSDFTITVSIGISQCQLDDSSWDDGLKRADIALYQAKENGRNQCIFNLA